MLQPPSKVQPMPQSPEFSQNYRKTSFLIQAANQGNLDSFQLLLQHGSDIKESGIICLSRRRKNIVVGSVMAAAAYHGNHQILKFAMTRLDVREYGSMGALESQDAARKAGAF